MFRADDKSGKLERGFLGRVALWVKSGCGRYMAVKENMAFSGKTRADAERLGYENFGIHEGWTIKNSYQYVMFNRDQAIGQMMAWQTG
jgi:hypothetical protein